MIATLKKKVRARKKRKLKSLKQLVIKLSKASMTKEAREIRKAILNHRTYDPIVVMKLVLRYCEQGEPLLYMITSKPDFTATQAVHLTIAVSRIRTLLAYYIPDFWPQDALFKRYKQALIGEQLEALRLLIDGSQRTRLNYEISQLFNMLAQSFARLKHDKATPSAVLAKIFAKKTKLELITKNDWHRILDALFFLFVKWPKGQQPA
jgi:hypothetical protein